MKREITMKVMMIIILVIIMTTMVMMRMMIMMIIIKLRVTIEGESLDYVQSAH